MAVIKSPLSCIIILKGWNECSSKMGSEYRMFYLCTDHWDSQMRQTKSIVPHSNEGISGWLTYHNPSICELGEVRKHVAMCCIEVVGLDHHLHQFTSIAHFYTVSHSKGIYLYYYMVKNQIVDYRIVTTVWSHLKISCIVILAYNFSDGTYLYICSRVGRLSLNARICWLWVTITSRQGICS